MGEENRSLVVLLVQLARYAKLTDAVCCVVSLDVFFFLWGDLGITQSGTDFHVFEGNE